jgi:hypothetical protein
VQAKDDPEVIGKVNLVDVYLIGIVALSELIDCGFMVWDAAGEDSLRRLKRLLRAAG